MFHADAMHAEFSQVVGALSGEIDMATAPTLEAGLLAAVVASPDSTAVVECGGVTFLDSSGVHMLEDVVEQSSKAVHLVNVVGAPRRVFEILDLCRSYGIDESTRD
jgi:anti-sigma B factor antagonist